MVYNNFFSRIYHVYVRYIKIICFGRFTKWRLIWDTSCFHLTLGWRFCTSMFWPPAPRMSFINGLSDFTVSTSFQPSSTATQRFNSDQIWLPWILASPAVKRGGCQGLQAPGWQASGCGVGHVHYNHYPGICRTLSGGLCQENRRSKVHWW